VNLLRLAIPALLLVALAATGEAADAVGITDPVELDRLFPGFADHHTAGLWLFDEPQYLHMTLTDAGGEMDDLRLLDGGRLEPGRFGNALRCSATAGPAAREACQAKEYDGLIPAARPVARPERLLAALAGGRWTCEFWLQPTRLPTGAAVLLELGTDDVPTLCCALDGSSQAFVVWGAAVPGGFTCPTDVALLGDGRWHHVALIYEEGRLRHALDGRSQHEPTAAAEPPPSPGEIGGLVGVVSGAAIENGVMNRRDPVCVEVRAAVDSFWGETHDLAWIERWRGRIDVAALPGDPPEPHQRRPVRGPGRVPRRGRRQVLVHARSRPVLRAPVRRPHRRAPDFRRRPLPVGRLHSSDPFPRSWSDVPASSPADGATASLRGRHRPRADRARFAEARVHRRRPRGRP